MNNKSRDVMFRPDEPDSGMVAGIVIAVVTVVLIIAALVSLFKKFLLWKIDFGFQVAFIVYRHFLHRNVTSMNFDNPVYRKTTEDQFSIEKNQYHPQRIYPSTVAEEVRALSLDPPLIFR